MEATTVQFVLLVVAISFVGFFLMTGQDLFKSVYNMSSEKEKPHITVINYDVSNFKVMGVGDDTRYTFNINPTISINAQKDPVTIVPVLIYKGVEKKINYVKDGTYYDTFTIDKGESANGYILYADILSYVPPFKKLDDSSGLMDFKNNVVYYFDPANKMDFFKLYINQMSVKTLKDSDGNPIETCAVSFASECKKSIVYSKSLMACKNADSVDETCSQEMQLCGAVINVTIFSADCGMRSARVNYRTTFNTENHGKFAWEIKDNAVLNFFKKDPNSESNCIDINSKNLEQVCFNDLIGTKLLEFDPLSY